MDDIIKLIDLSLEDGRLSQNDYRIILKKAEAQGITEEEFNLILSKRSKNFDTNRNLSQQASSSKIPYIIAIIAVAFTFFDWIGAYSRSTVMGSSASWDFSFSGWWGGYGASVVIIYAIGCYFYFKGNRFYWLAGLLAVADAMYIYSAITNSDVSVSYSYGGYGGSAEYGYELLWGFWLFVIASVLFALTALFTGNRSSSKTGFKRFTQNFKAGRKILGISTIINIVVLTLILIFDDFDDILFIMILSCLITLILSLITLFVYIFSPSTRWTGYIILGITTLLFIGFYFSSGERAEHFMVFMVLMSFPICYMVVERFLASGNTIPPSIVGIWIILLIGTMNIGCSDQPKAKFQMDNSNSINGTYTAESNRVKSSLTITGNIWFGNHTETSFGNLISSGSGIVDGNKIYDEYGVELGYISNGSAYVNIGGMQVKLQKE